MGGEHREDASKVVRTVPCAVLRQHPAPHAFANRSADKTEFISAATPAGHEHFFRETDELSRSGRFNRETSDELCQRHGISLL